MKLEIRWQGVTPTPELFDHVKRQIVAQLPRSSWPRLRISLFGIGDDWFRCRLEMAARDRATRVIDSISTELTLAIEVAAERMGEVLAAGAHPPSHARGPQARKRAA